MKAIVTVIGSDQVGIIARVSGVLASHNVNILDITQTILQDTFVMVALVDLSAATSSFLDVQDALSASGEEIGMSIRMQRQDIFEAMHRI